MNINFFLFYFIFIIFFYLFKLFMLGLVFVVKRQHIYLWHLNATILACNKQLLTVTTQTRTLCSLVNRFFFFFFVFLLYTICWKYMLHSATKWHWNTHTYIHMYVWTCIWCDYASSWECNCSLKLNLNHSGIKNRKCSKKKEKKKYRLSEWCTK